MKPSERLPAVFNLMNKKREELEQQRRLELREQEDARLRRLEKRRPMWWKEDER